MYQKSAVAILGTHDPVRFGLRRRQVACLFAGTSRAHPSSWPASRDFQSMVYKILEFYHSSCEVKVLRRGQNQILFVDFGSCKSGVAFVKIAF
jgi:hypothetical protein